MLRSVLIWGGLLVALIVPIVAAANSPQLAWREPIYIAAGFAGIVGLALMLLQPLLARAVLPGLPMVQSRRMHRWIGGALTLAVVVHIVGLWITSPPDVIDVLLFASPTPFSVWGALAMWAVFLTAVLAALRRRLRLRPKTWRRLHMGLAVVLVGGTIIHAVQIQGTMETLTKTVLCAAVALATLIAVLNLRSRSQA